MYPLFVSLCDYFLANVFFLFNFTGLTKDFFLKVKIYLSQWTATKFKEEKLYCISMHPTILYDSECWILKKQHKIRVRVAEIKIIK